MNAKLQILFDGDETGMLDPDSSDSFSFGNGADKDICISTKDANISLIISNVDGRWWLKDDNSEPPALILGRRFDLFSLSKNVSVSLGSHVIEFCPQSDSSEGKTEIERIKDAVYSDVVSNMKSEAAATKNISDEELSERVEHLTDRFIDHRISGSGDPKLLDEIRREIVEDILHLGPLEPLIADDSITEIMVISYDTIFVEQKGKISSCKRGFRNPEHLLTVIERIVSPIGRRVDESSPLVDARLHDGSRVNAVIPPITPDGACLTIRKFGKAVFT
ncbi:MAG TPA: ATPase, T2SS/T4P/T4SS family, partial [Victivallales bacterium]|nr:ATPase, T2SS/T4P/T4SS family [Victivallales bacterium]